MKHLLRKDAFHKYTTKPDDPSDPAGIHAYYGNIIRAMPNNVYWLDRDCVTLGCNENVLKLVGLKSYDEFVGITYEEMGKLANWTQGEAESFKRDDMEVMERGEPKLHVEEPPVHNKDGSVSYYLSSRVPIKDDNDEVIGVVGISVDITPEKEAEKLRLEKKAAEERADTMKLIAAAIAHELRTPLRAIDAAISGVEDYLPKVMQGYNAAKEAGLDIPYIDPGTTKVLSNAFSIGHSETKAAFNIVDMLLVKADLAHIETAEFKVCSMNECLKESLQRYHFDMNEQELVKVDTKDDFKFEGSEILVVHIFFNLLKNALYYVRAASKGDISIWYEEGEKTNSVYFKDTGTGISPEKLPRIFDRFFSDTKHGTGVGLAFCKLVMKSMGGDITCNSKEGEYTEFVLTFPTVR